jgi:hypothetical protein
VLHKENCLEIARYYEDRAICVTPALEVEDSDKADNACWAVKYSLGYDDEITKRNAMCFTQVSMDDHPGRLIDPNFQVKYDNALWWQRASSQNLHGLCIGIN